MDIDTGIDMDLDMGRDVGIDMDLDMDIDMDIDVCTNISVHKCTEIHADPSTYLCPGVCMAMDVAIQVCVWPVVEILQVEMGDIDVCCQMACTQKSISVLVRLDRCTPSAVARICTCLCTCLCMRACLYTCMHACMSLHMLMHMHNLSVHIDNCSSGVQQPHSHARVRCYAYTHACTQLNTRINTHLYTCLDTCLYTCLCTH